MRDHGTRFECLRMRPHDHIGWVFAGPAEFAALARPFLAEGAERGEKLMYVAEDPATAALASLDGLAGLDGVQVTSIADIYGESGIVNAARQRATFSAALADALTQGYTGIRVAADNTPLVTDEKRLKAWIGWEIVADRFIAENAVTGLCAFNRDKIDVDRLRHLATLHPLSSAAAPAPQFRLFADDGELCVEGEVDSFAVSQLWLALDVLPAKTAVRVDLDRATLRGSKALAALSGLAGAGVSVTIEGRRAAIRELRAAGLVAGERLAVHESPAP
jgi:hypothetical protein